MVLQALKSPDDLVVMGRILAPFGIKGWLKIQPFTAESDCLSALDTWWLGRDGDWRQYRVVEAKPQGRGVVAKLEGCEDRETALEFRGKQVAVTRDVLPRPGTNEFYWADLIGLRVVNSAAQDFGEVTRILETGANDVLVVQGECERLIPFIADVIQAVDLAAGEIRVDWGADY
ncbi:MAG: ribosome maturation factor RimM [Burkholderiales bacterium]|nr:ribosome maturation factor RimM [Burkholderiales bacterium]